MQKNVVNRLRSFCKFNRLKKLALNFMATRLEANGEVIQARKTFKKIDLNFDGDISAGELK